MLAALVTLLARRHRAQMDEGVPSSCHVHPRNLQCPVNVDSGRSGVGPVLVIDPPQQFSVSTFGEAANLSVRD
jgi:hypothetical protein